MRAAAKPSHKKVRIAKALMLMIIFILRNLLVLSVAEVKKRLPCQEGSFLLSERIVLAAARRDGVLRLSTGLLRLCGHVDRSIGSKFCHQLTAAEAFAGQP